MARQCFISLYRVADELIRTQLSCLVLLVYWEKMLSCFITAILMLEYSGVTGGGGVT